MNGWEIFIIRIVVESYRIFPSKISSKADPAVLTNLINGKRPFSKIVINYKM